MSTIICYQCGKKSRNLHYKKCNIENINNDDFKYNCIKRTYHNYQEVISLYNEDNSVLTIANILNISYSHVQFIIKYNGLELKTIKEISNSNKVREKYKKTCLEKYGAENTLSKNTVGYHNRNATVFKKYGVENVFQLENIKSKLNETILTKYGVKRVTNGEKVSKTKKSWSDEHRREINRKSGMAIKVTYHNMDSDKKLKIAENISMRNKKYWENLSDENKYNYLRNSFFKCSGKQNKLESRISEILTKSGINFEYSFFISSRQYDFKISNNMLIEVQGDFWHANPLFYSENDILPFPNTPKLAKDIWEKDIKKLKLAQDHGYRILYLWENEIRKCNDIELMELINQKIEEELRHLSTNPDKLNIDYD